MDAQGAVPVEPERGMTDDELASLLGAQEAQSIGYYTSEIANEQALSLDYYYGRPFGDEQPGQSQVVDRTVAVVVDNALAAILKPFVSSDEAVCFSPKGPEDEEQAEQATEYVNYIFYNDNPGFQIMHDWFKAGLIEKLGIVKTIWKDTTAPRETTITVDPIEFGQLQAEVVDGPYDMGNGLLQARISETYADGYVCVETIPSEEFRITPYAKSLDEAPYLAHVTRKTRSDLVSMGFDEDIVETLSKFAETEDDPRDETRYADEDFAGERAGLATDKATEEIWVAHEFPLVDFDGDGIAERREIIRCGTVILYNEKLDSPEDHPFSTVCPVPMMHKVWGLSLADQTRDLQRISSVLWRQALDNTYRHNNPRPVLPEAAERSDGTTVDDLLDSSPGAIVRTAGNVLDLGSMTIPFVADKALMLMQYAEQQQEARTGVTRIGQGLGADVLKKQEQTMGGLQLVEQAQNSRLEMMARIFAETGVKSLFRRILRLVVRHQPRERVIRLRNEWVPIDPRGWNTDMDLTISVGLGVGSRTEQAAASMNVLNVFRELAATPYGYMLKPEGVYGAMKKFLNANGFKNTDDFLTEPGPENPPPEPQPDPKTLEIQSKAQIEQQKSAIDVEKTRAELALKQQAGEQDLRLKAEEAAAKLQLEREKVAAELQLARERMVNEHQLAIEQMHLEMQLEEKRIEAQREASHEQAQIKADADKAKLKKNRPGGSLAE